MIHADPSGEGVFAQSKPVSKTTVLDGYYATGDHECFCFDRHDGPSEHSAAWAAEFPDKQMSDRNFPDYYAIADAGRDSDECRSYPNDWIPDGAEGFGRWTITVRWESA